MSVARKVDFGKAREKFDDILGFIEGSFEGGCELADVSRGLLRLLMELGRDLIQAYIDAYGSGDPGKTLERGDRVLKRLDEPYIRRLVTVFGEVFISRYVYGTRRSQRHEAVPLDAALNLPESDFCYHLQELDQAQVVKSSYGESKSSLEMLFGFKQSVGSLEKMNRDMAGSADSFNASLPAPCADSEESIISMACDNKGVRILSGSGDSGRRSRLGKGEKPGKKRMACVGAVYTIAPFVRSAEDVVDEIFRDKARKRRPRPLNKRVRSEMSREVDGVFLNGKDEIFKWLKSEVESRDPHQKKQIVCLMDGERALWKRAEEHFPYVIGVLDIYHVLERLWKAAHCFHAEGSEEAEEFVRLRLKRLLEGGAGYVIGGLKQMKTKGNLSSSRVKQLDSVILYLENNREHMRYDCYLDAGYPIGSGVAEGACRHLVKDRMELSGMRWSVEGAQAMLALRAIYLNDEWHDFQRHRIELEKQRLYPYREEILAQWKKSA